MTAITSPPNLSDLAGKCALVTGATSGLGRRFALLLAQCGAKVAVAGRRVDRLESLVAEIEGFDGRATPVEMDVTDVASIRRAVEHAETELGAIDILVNNAGVNKTVKAVDATPEDFDFMMDANVRGAFFVATEVGRRMITRGGGGRVVNIASMAAKHVLPGLSIYCMSKAAAAMMTHTLSAEWARHAINVNAICPGYIRTEINAEFFDGEQGQKFSATFPRGRVGAPEDLDGTLLLLVSDHARFITGAVIEVHDGQVRL